MEEDTSVKIQIPRPDRRVFQGGHGNVVSHVMSQPQPVYMIEKIEYPSTGGIYIYHVGSLFPVKGFPFPEACQANNIVKRQLIETIRNVTKNPFLAFSMLFKKHRDSFLNSFGSFGNIILGAYFLEPERYQISVKELRLLFLRFMVGVGVPEFVAQTLARIFATILEYDNAYLLRLQDLANETDAQKLYDNPVKEFKRLLSILNERDNRVELNDKFRRAVLLLRGLFLLPKVKKAFRDSIRSIDFTKIQMDEADRYHVLKWKDYKFLGMTDEERHEKYLEMHNGKPPQALMVQG